MLARLAWATGAGDGGGTFRHALPRDVVEDVASRIGGVPLFVEEVTRLLLERGEGGGGIQAIPATLQQSGAMVAMRVRRVRSRAGTRRGAGSPAP